MTDPFDAYERAQWAGRADAFRGAFAMLCAMTAPSLLDAAHVTRGVRLLDVGTGTGTVGRLAADRGAVVTAVDAEPSMVDAAREFLPDVRFGMLPDLPFAAGSFDTAVANFVLNHVGDPAAAIAGMDRVVRTGGHIAVSVWSYPPPPLQSLIPAAMAAAGAPAVDLPRVAPARDFDRTVDGLRNLLVTSGLSDVGVHEMSWQHRVDPEVWWAGPANGIGSAGFVLSRQTPEMRARIKHEYDRLAAAHTDPDGLLALATSAVIAAGRTGAVPGAGAPVREPGA